MKHMIPMCNATKRDLLKNEIISIMEISRVSPKEDQPALFQKLEKAFDELNYQIVDDDVYPLNLYKATTFGVFNAHKLDVDYIIKRMDYAMQKLSQIASSVTYCIILCEFKYNIPLSEMSSIFSLSAGDIIIEIGKGTNILREILFEGRYSENKEEE